MRGDSWVGSLDYGSHLNSSLLAEVRAVVTAVQDYASPKTLGHEPSPKEPP